MHFIGDLLVSILRYAFFGKVRVAGKMPKDGPNLFCITHMNCYMDAIITSSTLPYNVFLVLAEIVIFTQSAKQKIVGLFAKHLKCISIARPIDSAIQGSGEILAKGKTIYGTNTKFLTELKVGLLVECYGHEGYITRIVSDTEAEFSGTLPSVARGYKILPKLDHSQMFANVLDKIKDNKSVGIFPEGRSHETPGVIKFKSGASAIIYNCAENDIPLNVYSVGINYSLPDKTGGNVTVSFSEPMKFGKEVLVGNKKEAIGKITEKIQREAKNNVVQMDSYNEVKMTYFSEKIMNEKSENKVKKWKLISEKFNKVKKTNEKQYENVVESFENFRMVTRNFGVSKYFGEKKSMCYTLVLFLVNLLLLLYSGIGLVFIWASSIFIESNTQKAIKTLLRNIKFRSTGCDVVISNRAIYFMAVYLLSLPIEFVGFYLFFSDIQVTVLVFVLLQVYFYSSFWAYGIFNKNLKKIRLNIMSNNDYCALIQGRNNLKANIKRCLERV